MGIEVIINAAKKLKARIFKITPRRSIILNLDNKAGKEEYILFLFELQEIINNYKKSGNGFVPAKTKKEQLKRFKDKLDSVDIQFGYGVDYLLAKSIIDTIVERSVYKEDIVDIQQKLELLKFIEDRDFYKNIQIVSTDGYSIQKYLDLAKSQIKNNNYFVLPRVFNITAR